MGAAKLQNKCGVTHDDIRSALAFWSHFNIPFVKVPGFAEMAAELLANPDITDEDLERLKYLICYEIAHSDHPQFTDPMFKKIVGECKEVVRNFDAAYPGRVWI